MVVIVFYLNDFNVYVSKLCNRISNLSKFRKKIGEKITIFLTLFYQRTVEEGIAAKY